MEPFELIIIARSELTDHVDDIDSYDIIFLGYPNCWGTRRCLCLHSYRNMIFLGKQLFHFVLMKEAG